MNRHEIEIEDLSQGGRRGANLTLLSIIERIYFSQTSLLEEYKLQGERLHKYEGPGFNVKKITSDSDLHDFKSLSIPQLCFLKQTLIFYPKVIVLKYISPSVAYS